MTDAQMTDRFEEQAEKWKVNNLKEIRTRVSELPDLMVPTDGPDDRVFSWHIGELSEDQAVTLAKIKVDVGRLFKRLVEQQATITELREKLREVLDGWPTIKKQDKEIERLRTLLIGVVPVIEDFRPDLAKDITDELYREGTDATLAEQPKGEKG